MRVERLRTPPLLDADLVADRPFRFGQVSGTVLATLTLEAGGRIGSSRHPNETSWRIDDGDVEFVDDAGRTTTRFTAVGRAHGQLLLVGEFLGTGSLHYLSAPLVPGEPELRTTGPSPRPDGAIDHLTEPVWGIGRLGQPVLTDLFLVSDGRIRGAEGPNEARWAMGEDGELLFLAADGVATTRFDMFVPTSRGCAWVGPFLGDGQTIHYLVPRFDPRDPDAVPPFADSLIDRHHELAGGWPAPGPPAVSRERYLESRRHLFSLARRTVFPEPAHGTEARIDALRDAFDEAVAEFGLDPRAMFWFSIKGTDATTLYDHVVASRPATCLQIGTFAGFSALLIADALRQAGGGRVVAVDPEIPHENVMTPVDVARRVADRLDLAGHCSFVRGWGSTMIGLPTYEEWKHSVPLVGQSLLQELGSVDVVFIDADHSVSATIADFMLVKDAVSVGGAVLFHDVFNWPSVTEAIEIILGDIHYDDGAHRLWEVDINTGPDGLAVLRRRPTPPSPALTIEVVDDSGRPVADALVTVIGHDTASTSTRGEVTFFREIAAGTHIEVAADGRGRTRTRVTEPTEGRAVHQTVRAEPV